MQTVISAPPRTGKTLWCVDKIDQISRKEPNRIIYTNIVGIDYPGVIRIQSGINKPFDWRDLPNGSVLIYDEAHEHPAFCNDDLLKDYDIDETPYNEQIDQINSNDKLLVKQKQELISKVKERYKKDLRRAKEDILDIGRSLTLHGHFGIDIYFVTQKPDLLNSYVRAATSSHYVLRRLFQLPACTIYEFPEIQTQFGNATRKNAISTKFWFYPKKLYKFYISAESHPVKSRFPLALIGLLILPIAIIAMGSKSAIDSGFFGLFPKDEKNAAPVPDVIKNTLVPASNSSNSVSNSVTNKAPLDLSLECRKAENLDKPECVQWFDKITNEKASVMPTGEVRTVSYNPNKPFDDSGIVSNLSYEVTSKPIFSGCMKKGSRYIAYTEQGTILNEVSQSDCKRLIENNDRPYNYFKQSNNTMVRSDPVEINTVEVKKETSNQENI